MIIDVDKRTNERKKHHIEMNFQIQTVVHKINGNERSKHTTVCAPAESEHANIIIDGGKKLVLIGVSSIIISTI